MMYLEKNIEEKKQVQREALERYIRQKDKEIAMLYMDDEEIARAKQTGDFVVKASESNEQSPGLKEFMKKRKEKRTESRNESSTQNQNSVNQYQKTIQDEGLVPEPIL